MQTDSNENPVILLVEDEPVLHDWVSGVVGQLQCRIFTASSGANAMEILGEKPVDLVISDSALPGEDGVTLLTKIRRCYPELVCILAPENGDADLLARAVNQAEVDHILRTPWQEEAILSALEHGRKKLRLHAEHHRYHAYARELETRVNDRTRELNLVIDHLEQRNEKLESTYQQLLQSDKMASLGLMAGTLAHDISNPLFVLEGTVELMENRLSLDRKGREYTASIREQIGRIEELVDSIRNYSRKSAGRFTRVNLIKVIEDSLRLTRKMLNLKEIRVVTHVPEQIASVYGNQNQLEQVVLNLIQNSIQAMDRGGRLTIEITPVQSEETGTRRDWRLTVSDTGSGIPEDTLGEVFNAFFTTKEEGTGLGLNICKRVVEEHQGEIEVVSTVDVGTMFTITIPDYETANISDNGRISHD